MAKNEDAGTNAEKAQMAPVTTEVAALEETDEQGTIRISENVIAAVVRKYVLEVAGVVRFASGGLVGGLADMLGRKSHEGSVVVDIEKEAVSITVTLVLEFGARIPDVASTVQDVVRERVEDLTGKHVAKVNVIVQDLEESPPPKAVEKKSASAKQAQQDADAQE